MRISINNRCSVLTDDDIKELLPALRGQASEMCIAWGLDRPTIGFELSGDTVPIDIFDNSDIQGALGYHDMVNGKPMARVFAKTDLEYGLSWKVTLSHEVLELIADATALASIQIGKDTFTALEVCDAVQADRYGETRGGHVLSNWLYPTWFDPYAEGPYDKMELCTKPLQLLPGGYILYWNPTTVGWGQANAQSIGNDVSRSKMAHRSLIRHEANKYGPLPADPFSRKEP
jgi:hypothetical protein